MELWETLMKLKDRKRGNEGVQEWRNVFLALGKVECELSGT